MKRRQRCRNHKATGRSWNEYVFGFIDYKGDEIWRCIECKEADEKWLIEYEIRKEKEAIEAIERSIKLNEEIEERQKKRREIMKNDLWDCEVRDILSWNTKLRGAERRKYKESIPKEILQLTRATVRLSNLVRDKKGAIIKEKEKEIERLKKLAEPILKCYKHGDLSFAQVIKSGKSTFSKSQKYKCRECMKEFHKNHYKKNKELILAKHKTYKQNNPDKIK